MANVVPKSFRAMMQRMGLSRITNSPVRRVEKAAVLRFVANRQLRQRAGGSERLPSVAAPSDAEVSSRPSPSPTLATPMDAHARAAAAAEALYSGLQSHTAIADPFRLKAQEAVRFAIGKATELLESARDGTWSTGSSLTVSADADPRGAYGKLRRALLAGRRDYYSRTPFDERWDDIRRCLDVLGRVSTGNTVVPFRDSGDAYVHMWRAVDEGQREVLWQTYICKDDYVGQTTMNKLVAARAERGCTTELLYDCGGNISGRSRLTGQLKQCGATVIPYRPFFRGAYEYVFKGFDWRISPGLRNHRKILLVDGRIGFCGGLNIGNEYCGPQAGGTGTFRDTHCSVTGPAIAHLREVYEDTKEPRPWKYSWTRWRQIAMTQLSRQYEARRLTVEENVRRLQATALPVLPGLPALQERAVGAGAGRSGRGGLTLRARLRSAGETTSRALQRMRWVRQAEKRAACARYNRRGADAQAGRVGSTGEQGAARAAVGSPARDTGDTVSGTVSDGRVMGGEAVEPGEMPVNRKGVMRRRLMEARTRALFSATDLPHKRSYTALLRQLPLADEEPVPEAEMYARRRPATTQILSCNPRYHDYSIQYAFWQVTRKCHRRIWITTPYYLPTKKLFRALLHAASRGVDVRLLAGGSQTTDPWFMWHASNYITGRLLRSGVRIYEFKGAQIMHAKTVVADSIWCSIGSYNWDVMSNKNLEVCLCQLDHGIAREMERQFLQDLAMSTEVKLEDHQQRSLWLRLTSWVFYNLVFLLERITFRSFSNQDLEDSAGTHQE